MPDDHEASRITRRAALLSAVAACAPRDPPSAAHGEDVPDARVSVDIDRADDVSDAGAPPDAPADVPEAPAPSCLPRGVALDAVSTFTPGTRRLYAVERVIVARDERGLYALSALCTHAGCTVDLDARGFVCPCHYSEYHDDGSVRAGPARRPLDTIALCVGDDGVVTVDPRVRVAADWRVPV